MRAKTKEQVAKEEERNRQAAGHKLKVADRSSKKKLSSVFTTKAYKMIYKDLKDAIKRAKKQRSYQDVIDGYRSAFNTTGNEKVIDKMIAEIEIELAKKAKKAGIVSNEQLVTIDEKEFEQIKADLLNKAKKEQNVVAPNTENKEK